ncbi:MAG: DNA methyltransferase [Candidatus Poribacteria bacterium]|nr:DNA methyltransferase [Candidatus Poribacteria bacterium]
MSVPVNLVNFENRTLFIADNFDILRGMDSETIDLIYLDPPFNTNRNYKAPIGSPAEGAEFKDIWTDEDVKDAWHGEVAETNEELYQIIQASEAVYDKSMKLYLMAMAVRLFEMHRILRHTGSIYLHCDPKAFYKNGDEGGDTLVTQIGYRQ